MNVLRHLLTLTVTLAAISTLDAQDSDRGRGGYDRGRGGFERGRGGYDRGRGSFDPSEFLNRLDTNGNGVIDPDEQQGPAQFMISRMQRSDPSIQVGQPIPLKQLAESFEKARAEREGGRGGDRSDRSGRDREREREIADKAVTIELLVPGFGRADEIEAEPLLGFGAAAELLTIEVTEADQQEAASRMRYFDKDKNGVLTKDELTAQFAGNPMDFDRNRDGKLTPQELAVRYAVRREGTEQVQRKKAQEKRGADKQRDRNKTNEQPDLFNGRRSYRVAGARRDPEGLPGFFSDRDANDDGQVTMAEFASDWSDEVVEQFFASDLNRDGVITTAEALESIERGDEPKSSSAAASPATLAASPAQQAAGNPSTSDKSDVKIDDKLLKVSQRIITRNDTNKDGVLTPSEWKDMLLSPAKSDSNRDGKVTAEEYALWMQNGRK